MELGQLRLCQGRKDEARSLLHEAIEILQKACELRPDYLRDRRSRDEARRVYR
jgi:hypothetical protein